jgi:hypothetical protein
MLVLPVCAFLLLSGCSRDADPLASPTPSAQAPPNPAEQVPADPPEQVPADPSATEDIPGTVACGALTAAVRDATLMTPGVVDAIVSASGTADAPIAESAQRMATAYASAVAERGTDSEPDAVAAVSAAAAEMSTVCSESGLEAVG